MVVQPCKRSFNNPPTGQHHKPFLVVGAEYDGQLIPTMGGNPCEQLTTIAPIDPDPPQLFACPAKPTQEEFGTIPILDGCGGDDDGQQ